MSSQSITPSQPRSSADHPDILASLELMSARLERMEQALSPFMGISSQAPDLLATVADSVDANVRSAASRGIDIEQRVASILQLAEGLTDPAVSSVLNALLGQFNKLEPLLLMATDAPGLAAAAVDTADAYARRARAAGVDVEQILTDTTTLVAGFSTAASRALADRRAGQAPPSLLGVIRLLGDADVRRTLGFFLTLAKQFGTTLNALPPEGDKNGPR